jgi:hypothetical protein
MSKYTLKLPRVVFFFKILKVVMFRVDSPWPVVLSGIPLVGMLGKFLYDGVTLEKQTVHNFAVRIIETFKDQLPPSCREMKEDAQVVDCFLETKGSNVISLEGSPEFIRDVQQYESRYSKARAIKTTTVVMIAITALSFYAAYVADRILTHPLFRLPLR